MNLGVKLGMDPKVLAGIINTSTGRTWSSDTYNPVPGVMEGVPSSNDYQGGFASDLMKKDLGLAIDAAHAAGSRLVLGEHTREFYEEITKAGIGGKDFSVAYKRISETDTK